MVSTAGFDPASRGSSPCIPTKNIDYGKIKVRR
jgi:hypothetical protein